MRAPFPLLSKILTCLAMLMGLLVFCFGAARPSAAQTLTTLHFFCVQQNCPDGSQPRAGLVQATDGNFYGTTAHGGASSNCGLIGCGTVFRITSDGDLSVLHSFAGPDGSWVAAGLVQASDGNFYGTTANGGGSCDCGTVFRISPGGALTTLYDFCSLSNCNDGSLPYAGLVQASDGNFYGTTQAGGVYNRGTIFKITPTGILSTLHSFGDHDGYAPVAALIQGTDGDLYGTTSSGGANGEFGTIFKITLSGVFTSLYSFCAQADCSDGAYSYASLLQAADGNFYGTTLGGGTGIDCPADSGGCGTLFKITPSGVLNTIYNFCSQPNCADGENPEAAVIQSADGSFAGTTWAGGEIGGWGTIFAVTSQGSLTVLHSFNARDGAFVIAPLIQTSDGSLYGTAAEGGDNDGGTIFKLSLAPLIPTTTVLASNPNPSGLGQAVTMTATVTAQNGSVPAGTVVFQSNGTNIGSAVLDPSGVAVFMYSGLNLGTDSLTAVYQGSPTLQGSTSNTVAQVVLPATTTTVTSSLNPSTVGQLVTFTATVAPAGPPQPTGTVSFTSNGSAISGCASVTLSNLTALCTTSTLPTGTDIVVASYSGDANYEPSQGSVVQIVNPVPTAVKFITLPPCRVVDTRNPNGTFGGPAIPGHSSRSFPLSEGDNPCGIPADALAYSLNVTVVTTTGHLGYLTIWPTGEGQPIVSTMNSPDGRAKANAAIVPAGTPSGSVSVYVTDTTNVILDINGYFTTSGSSTLEFYPLPPCRIVDTRGPDGDLGGPYLHGQLERDFPIPASTCLPPGITPAAYSFNVTALPHPAHQHLGYLTVWATGEPQPVVSTLNNPTGTNVANAAIVVAGSNGKVAVYPSNDTDLLLDIDGYFATPGAGGLSLYTVTPCRVLDTRGVGSGQPFQGELTVNVTGSPCAPTSAAQAYVFNATVVPPGALGYLTLWPDGQSQPVVSTLNAGDGAITSNMAIVPNANGSIDAYASALTQLILDISGYFAP